MPGGHCISALPKLLDTKLNITLRKDIYLKGKIYLNLFWSRIGENWKFCGVPFGVISYCGRQQLPTQLPAMEENKGVCRWSIQIIHVTKMSLIHI